MRATLRILLFAIPLSLIAPVAHSAAPAAPSGVTVTSASLAGASLNQAQAEVSWASAVSGALGYVITATAAGQTTVTKTITPGSLTSTILEGLDGGVSYAFRVASKNADGETAAPNVTFVTRSVPDAPTVAAPVVAKGQVTLSWTAPTNSGGVELTGYTITATGVPTVAANADSTTVLISGLAAGSKPTFAISAVNSIGSSIVENFATATIPDLPGIPTSLTAGPPVGSTIAATWAAPVDNGGSAVTSYTAYLYDSSNNEVTAQRKSDLTSAAASFTALAAGTYTIRVSATNIVGEGEKTLASSPQVVSATSALTANAPVISPATINDLPIDSTFVLSATAPSGGAVSLAVSPSSVCRIETATGLVTGVSAGTCSITASIARTGNYDDGVTPKSFNVVKVAQTINNFSTIPSQTGSGTVSVSASSVSGVPVTFTASGNCTVSSGTVSFTVGSCTITASASATSKYASATQSRTFSISAAAPPPSGGFTGGGTSTPVVLPSPSPTPTPSATPTPTASATPKPTPSPTPSASATPSAVATAKPSATPSAAPVVLKSNSYVALATSKTPTTNLSLTTSAKTLSVTAGKAIAVSLPTVPKGTTVVTSLKMPDGKTVQVSSTKTTKTGKFTVPSLLLKKPGTYTLQIKVGKTTKTVKVTVKK